MIKQIILFLLVLSTGSRCLSQVTVSGPPCAVPGAACQYVIGGSWSSSSWVRVCITGGTLSTGGNCTTGTGIITTVSVVWSDTSYHRLDVTSSAGNATLTVQGTTELGGGTVHPDDKLKLYDSTVTSYTFRCTAASGGSCNPHFMYQWQQSDNGMNWTNVPGATGQDMQFSGPAVSTRYFRRVTTETVSNTIVYSDVATLAVPY